MTSPSSPIDILSDPLVGQVVAGRYRVEALLDEGAMGRVYLAEQVSMKKRVALKVLKPELTRVPEVMARFEREAMAAAHIVHPNIATAIDSGRLEDKAVYLALEYVEGRTLRSEIERGPMPIGRVLGIVRQVAEALGAAHALEIVHRDLKPDNVMLVERDGHADFVKVLDFGVAKVPLKIAESRPLEPQDGALITAAGVVFGTPDYMAPEQALGQPVDHRADLYSLGVMFYEMLGGTRPFVNENDVGILGQQLSGEVPPLARTSGVAVPAKIEALVTTLLANESRRRVQSAAELVARIDELVALTPSELHAPPTPSDSTSERRISAAEVGETIPAPPSSEVETDARPTRVKAKPLRLPDWEVLTAISLLLVVVVAGVLLYRSRVAASVDSAPQVDVPEELATQVPTSAPASPEQSAMASASAGPEAELEPEVLTEQHVEDALKAGGLAIDALVKRFPDDGLAHLAAARHAFKGQQVTEAIASLTKAIHLDPSRASDPNVRDIVWKGAQYLETREATLALLQGPMKAAGADVIYDLATNVALHNTEIARLAGEWLDTKGFERASTPEASVAAALFRAPNCRIREALVLRAKNVGDRRSAVQLERFQAGKGCSSEEARPCNACLKDSADVTAALEAIAERDPVPTDADAPQ